MSMAWKACFDNYWWLSLQISVPVLVLWQVTGWATCDTGACSSCSIANIHLPATNLRQAVEDGLRAGTPDTHTGDADRSPCSWLWSDPAPSLWPSGEWIHGWKISLFGVLSVCLSFWNFTFQISKQILKEKSHHSQFSHKISPSLLKPHRIQSLLSLFLFHMLLFPRLFPSAACLSPTLS